MEGAACTTQLYSQTCLHLDVSKKQHVHTLDHFQTYQSHEDAYSKAGSKTILTFDISAAASASSVADATGTCFVADVAGAFSVSVANGAFNVDFV